MTDADHMGQVRQLRALAGNARPHDELFDEMHASARRIETLIGQLRSVTPRRAQIDDVEDGIDEIARGLQRLRDGQGGAA